MAKNFNTLRADLDRRLDEHPDGAAIRAKVRAELDGQIAAHEATLRDLRRARRLTQTQMATTLGITHAQVSRVENQADLYLSTLASYMEAMGGELKLVGVFGDQEVTITLDELHDKAPA
jgi:hypothetical protein